MSMAEMSEHRVILTFGVVIEQLSLAFDIMVKCSHAGPSNKSVNIF